MKEAALLVGVKTLWDGHPTLPTLVPGGLHEGRVGAEELPPGDAGRVYATHRAQLEFTEYNSGPWMLQTYRLDLMVFGRPGAGVIPSGVIRDAITDLLERSRRDELLVSGGCETVDIVLLSGSLAEDPAVKEAQDVYVTGAPYEIKLFVPRNVRP